ncbi:hypothetical protein FRC06_009280 [Ceratobasidium sp. 370]|nr:hypothetical protein FRC06_009280 [Ceratobasidium sp. 370]
MVGFKCSARRSSILSFGHGTYILSKEGEGKEALRIPEQRGSLHPSDPDLGASSNRATQYTRVSSIQVNRKEDINYYNEAIVTSYKPLPLLDTLTKDVTEYNIIRDSVLNDYFSKLPEGCKLMCTLDCCHSGRLINNNFKLAGAGFRGRCIYATAQGRVPDEPPEAFTDMDDLIEQLGKQTIKDLTPLENDTTGASVSTPAEGASQLLGVSTPQGSPPARGAKTPGVQAAPRPPVFSQNMTQNYISPLVSKIMELLPAEEASRDKIKADMLTWSGCHQRQGAVDYSDKRGGLFTRSFTESVMESSNPVTVEQLFNKLNQRIANEARNLRDGRGQIRPVLQYAQNAFQTGVDLL